VAGIVAGRPTKVAGGARTIRGAAPGAKLISLSTGAVIFVFGADSALNWVLDNHRAPCGPRVSATQCPPIKATNNSYGPQGGGEFDPNGATTKIQRALAAEGVVTVWAQGNDGGDGSENLSNPPAQDPTGGIVGVAAYDDRGTGTRQGAIADFSSRGDRTRQATWPDVSAPGVAIESACRAYLPICSTGFAPVDGGNYNTIEGTSMAAPHIAGIVAQLVQAKPSATPAALEDAIVQTATTYADGAPFVTDARRGGLTSFDKGHGLVDVTGAVQRLTGSTTTATTTTRVAKKTR
jgi:serine protease AprX